MTALDVADDLAVAAPSTAARRRAMSYRTLLIALQAGIAVALVAAWEIGASTGAVNTFLFSSPSRVGQVIVERWQSGDLVLDVGTTALEVALGFVIGAVGGSVIGLLLWYSKFVADLSAPFIAAIGSIPVLAIAPMTIIWFGTGLESKIVIVAFSCVVVSLTTSYRGARMADQDLLNLVRSFGGNRGTAFRRVVVPASMTWVVQALKLNVGFAIVGAIVGEYISSNAGIGHMILLGSSNFSVNIVLAGLALVMVTVLVFTLIVSGIEHIVLRWEK
ncbi:NitT/TauT family transport system permease protein [Promicromonospora sp. AC04]|uniref:ABC transporter permease n=1 Tax=Promicromonospora sp. AC04 TaxID=2135723 RepID=UPI000D3689D4|nr:ABC transporter permease [Promicromonospora sp. AC04]PUB24845.1 NitT/TauT family transport system permease protein [Promicromonospora sp. AC04]